VGAIPEELDYRNWYRYEMEVTTQGEEGVVIDRRTKSMGSGGEQAVPNYLLVLTIAHFVYQGKKIRLHTLLFDEPSTASMPVGAISSWGSPPTSTCS